MNVFKYILRSIVVRQKAKRLNKQLNDLRKKLEVKKILSCALANTCNLPDCPFLDMMKKHENTPT